MDRLIEMSHKRERESSAGKMRAMLQRMQDSRSAIIARL